MLVLAVLRRHFQNHCAKPRKIPRVWLLDHMDPVGVGPRGRERTSLRQERGFVQRGNRKSRAARKPMQGLRVEEAREVMRRAWARGLGGSAECGDHLDLGRREGSVRGE